MRPLLASLISLILLQSVTAAKFPDGAWNNKLWNKATLEKGVKNGDADALAEWAYCSSETKLGIKHDAKLIYTRSKKSMEGGSILAHIISSDCYLHCTSAPYDPEKSITLLKHAVDAAHPLAMAKYAAFHISSQNHVSVDIGVKRELQVGLKYLKLAEAGGAVEAKFIRGRSMIEGLNGIVDKEDGYNLISECSIEYNHLASSEILHKAVYSKHTDTQFIDEKSALQAKQNLHEAHLLSSPLGSHWKYITEIENGSQPHTAIPHAIKLANDKYGPMMSSLTYWTRYARFNRPVMAYIIAGEYSSQDLLATELYPRSYRGFHISIRYLSKLYLDPKNNKKVVSPTSKAGIHTIKEHREYLKHTPDCPHGHNSLGSYLIFAGKNHAIDKSYKYRAAAHNEYLCTGQIGGYWIASNYLYHSVSKEDKIKAAASAKATMPHLEGAWKKQQNRWYKQAMKGLSLKDKKQVQALVDDGYPYAEKYRRAAFELLQKAGDIPAHRTFISEEEEDEDDEGSAMLSTPDSQVYLCDNNINPAHKGNNLDAVLLKYLKGEKIQDGHKRSLVKLFTLEHKILLAHLDKVKDQDPAVMAKKAEVLKAMKEENLADHGKNRLGAKLGWYLVYKNNQMTSSPILSVVEPNSTAEGAKLWTADVIETIAGVDMKSADSRNRFKRFISLWPNDLPVQVIIRRSTFGHRNTNNSSKKQKRKTTTLIFN